MMHVTDDSKYLHQTAGPKVVVHLVSNPAEIFGNLV